MSESGDPMVTLRENPVSSAFRGLAPIGQVLGEPRFRWVARAEAWLYRVDVIDSDGRELARGWSGERELPLAWLKAPDGLPPELVPGGRYRWRVYAYDGPPTEEPTEAAPEEEFLFLGP